MDGLKGKVLGRGIVAVLAAGLFGSEQARALTIQVDYRYDSNGFFSEEGHPEGAAGAMRARASVEAAAARWSAIIDETLAAVRLRNDRDDPRIGITHPGTGEDWQISPASGPGTDALVRYEGLADEYRGEWEIGSDVWILYVGARALETSPNLVFAGGGTAQGDNFLEVYADPGSVHNRNFNRGRFSLPMWGGYLTFNLSSAVVWNFDHNRAPEASEADLYTIALHEIGHALGLGSDWEDWYQHVNSGFVGANALAGHNADNGQSLERLLLVADGHWALGQYKAKIFPAGSPNYTGTVGRAGMQALLMEPKIPIGNRYEITNIEVGALQDVGWSVISGEVAAPEIAENFSINRGADRSIELTWTSVPGASYSIQTSADGRVWSDVMPAITAQKNSAYWLDGDSAFVDPTPPARTLEKKFYRILSR